MNLYNLCESFLKLAKKRPGKIERLLEPVTKSPEELKEYQESTREEYEIPEHNKIKQILKKHNIEGKVIGKGGFSVVIKPTNGKYVIKLTKSPHDAKIIYKLNKLRNELPKDCQKHILKVYDSFYDYDFKVFIIKCELLEPMENGPNILSAYFSGDSIKNRSEIFADNNLFMNIVNNFKHDSDEYLFKNFNMFKYELSLRLFNYVKELYIDTTSYTKFENLLKDNLIEFLDNEMNYIINNIKKAKDNIDISTEEKDNFINEFAKYIAKTYVIIMIPSNIQQLKYNFKNLELLKDNPTVRSFIKTLTELKKHNINFADLNVANIMLRPGTNDIVISDPGRFL